MNLEGIWRALKEPNLNELFYSLLKDYLDKLLTKNKHVFFFGRSLHNFFLDTSLLPYTYLTLNA